MNISYKEAERQEHQQTVPCPFNQHQLAGKFSNTSSEYIFSLDFYR
jgi:hypothetical protein